MTIDLVCTQPNNVPFPLWSKWVRANAHRFQMIYIALHTKNMNGYDFTALIKDLLDGVKNVEWIEGINPMDGSDWRNMAVNEALKRSTAEVVWFTEQDFFIKNTNVFFSTIEKELETYGVIGFPQDKRLHPACIFAKRELIEKTRKDFSPIDTDHFYRFTADMLEHTEGKFGSIAPAVGAWFHMNGLTQNYTLAEQDIAPNYDLENFLWYNRKSRETLPELCADWTAYDIYVDLTFKAERLTCPISEYLEEYTE